MAYRSSYLGHIPGIGPDLRGTGDHSGVSTAMAGSTLAGTYRPLILARQSNCTSILLVRWRGWGVALGSAGWALAEGRRGGTAPGGRTRPVEKAYAAPEGPALKCPLYYLYAVHCNLSLAGCDHGTHVAGIAAGQTSPVGFDGVARGANIIVVQVCSRLHDSTGNTLHQCGALEPLCTQLHLRSNACLGARV